MSMYWSGDRVLGLIIKDSETIEYFKEHYIKLNPEDFQDTEDPEDAMEEWLSCCEQFVSGCNAGEGIEPYETKTFDAQYYGEEVNEGCFFAPSDPESTEVTQIYSSDMPFIFVYASYDLSSRSHFKHGFYSCLEELVDELKDKVQAYLPEDFDWKRNIGDLMYGAFC